MSYNYHKMHFFGIVALNSVDHKQRTYGAGRYPTELAKNDDKSLSSNERKAF